MATTQPATDPGVLFNRLLARGRLRHLQLIAALADAGSVQRAAATVGMSQPAATQALSDLEELLEAPLFERHNRGVRPTALGDVVVPVARNVLQALRAATETLSALQAGAQAFLRLGCIPAAASGVLARALPALLQARPGLQVELIEENMVHLLPELAAGRLDAVVCRRPQDVPAPWQFELLLRDEPMVVAAPGHPMAGPQPVALADLVHWPWVLPPKGMGVRGYYDRLWAGHAPQPPLYPMATTALPVVLEVMRTTQAVCLMPQSIAQTLVDTGVAVALHVALPESMESSLEGLGLLTTGFPDGPALAALRLRLRTAAS